MPDTTRVASGSRALTRRPAVRGKGKRTRCTL
jgi:hypothetical protein